MGADGVYGSGNSRTNCSATDRSFLPPSFSELGFQRTGDLFSLPLILGGSSLDMAPSNGC